MQHTLATFTNIPFNSTCKLTMTVKHSIQYFDKGWWQCVCILKMQRDQNIIVLSVNSVRFLTLLQSTYTMKTLLLLIYIKREVKFQLQCVLQLPYFLEYVAHLN